MCSLVSVLASTLSCIELASTGTGEPPSSAGEPHQEFHPAPRRAESSVRPVDRSKTLLFNTSEAS